MTTQNIKTTQERAGLFYNHYKAKAREKSCNKCLSNVHFEKSRLGWKCNKKGCNNRASLTESSFFDKRNLTIEIILDIVYYLTQNMSTKNIRLVLNVTNKTIRRYKKKLTKLLKKLFKTHNFKLGGKGVIVEVDESKFGHRKYNRGRAVEGVWVMGLVEKTPKRRVIMGVIENKTAETLRKKIKKYVAKGSVVYSDGWKGYCGLESLGYTHKTVNHRQNYVSPETGCYTNTIEGNWYGVKCGIPKRHYN